jgi:hypothetical protein
VLINLTARRNSGHGLRDDLFHDWQFGGNSACGGFGVAVPSVTVFLKFGKVTVDFVT